MYNMDVVKRFTIEEEPVRQKSLIIDIIQS